MSERKALLILHGKQALNDEVRAAVEAKRAEGWDLSVRLTWEAGDARRLVDEGLAAGHTRLIAGGGDGTLRDIAEALANAPNPASLVLLPLGTANDFARAAGVPLEPAAALELLEVAPRAVDLGEVGGQIFLNMATGGLRQSGDRQHFGRPEESPRRCCLSVYRAVAFCRAERGLWRVAGAGFPLARRTPGPGHRQWPAGRRRA